MFNVVVEWGVSVVKRVKSRLRSRFKNDMMVSLFYIFLNGFDYGDEECKEMFVEVIKVWRKTYFRNLLLLKKFLMVGGLDYEGSFYYLVIKIDIGVQVEFLDDFQVFRLVQEDNEVFVEIEFDVNVQVVVQVVVSNIDLCYDVLDVMDMGDVEFGVDLDFEFDMEDDQLF